MLEALTVKAARHDYVTIPISRSFFVSIIRKSGGCCAADAANPEAKMSEQAVGLAARSV